MEVAEFTEHSFKCHADTHIILEICYQHINIQRPLYLFFSILQLNIIEPHTLCLPITSLYNIIQFNVVN